MFLCFVSNGLAGKNAGFDMTQVATSQECLGFVAQSASAYVDPTALDVLFKNYFAFDKVLSVEIMGFYFLAFVMGSVLGRTVRYLNKF